MNILLHILAFFVLGVVVYYIDSRVGLKIHRSWYNLTHKYPLPEHIHKGMIIRQPFFQRLIIAALIVGAEVFISGYLGAASVLVDVLLGVAGLVGMILGFYFAGSILKIVPGTVGKAVDYLEKVESGETNIKEDVIGGAAAMGTKITDAVAEKGVEKVIGKIMPDKKEKEVKQETPGPEPEPKKEEKPEEEDDQDWRDGIDKFLKK